MFRPAHQVLGGSAVVGCAVAVYQGQRLHDQVAFPSAPSILPRQLRRPAFPEDLLHGPARERPDTNCSSFGRLPFGRDGIAARVHHSVRCS